MDTATLAVMYLGRALMASIIGFVVCILAALGYNTYIKYQDKNKKIEALAQNSNQNLNDDGK